MLCALYNYNDCASPLINESTRRAQTFEAHTQCAYPQRDGQAKLTRLASRLTIQLFYRPESD